MCDKVSFHSVVRKSLLKLFLMSTLPTAVEHSRTEWNLPRDEKKDNVTHSLIKMVSHWACLLFYLLYSSVFFFWWGTKKHVLESTVAIQGWEKICVFFKPSIEFLPCLNVSKFSLDLLEYFTFICKPRLTWGGMSSKVYWLVYKQVHNPFVGAEQHLPKFGMVLVFSSFFWLELTNPWFPGPTNRRLSFPFGGSL